MEDIVQYILFNENECSTIKNMVDSKSYKRSQVTNQSKTTTISDYRKSNQSSLEVKEFLKNLLLKKLNKFGILSLPKSVDILKYEVGDEFKRHIDNGYPHEYRYKTLIIQLSKESDYIGGELDIFENEKITVDKTIGNTILFNSSLEHSANKILKGTRYCLVMWLEKKHFGFDNTII